MDVSIDGGRASVTTPPSRSFFLSSTLLPSPAPSHAPAFRLAAARHVPLRRIRRCGTSLCGSAAEVRQARSVARGAKSAASRAGRAAQARQLRAVDEQPRPHRHRARAANRTAILRDAQIFPDVDVYAINVSTNFLRE